MVKKTIVSAMIVGNDASRYLNEVLEHLQTFVDGLVILDDGSTDGTETLCLSQPKLLAYHKRPYPIFAKSPIAVRQELWAMLESIDPEWVFCLDADERFDDEIRLSLPNMIRQEHYEAVRFPVYHLWGDRRHIRIDQGFNPQRNYELLLHRYQSDRPVHWQQPGSYADRCPLEIHSLPSCYSHIRLYHLGWANPKAIRENPLPDYPLHPSHQFNGCTTSAKELIPTLSLWDTPS